MTNTKFIAFKPLIKNNNQAIVTVNIKKWILYQRHTTVKCHFTTTVNKWGNIIHSSNLSPSDLSFYLQYAQCCQITQFSNKSCIYCIMANKMGKLYSWYSITNKFHKFPNLLFTGVLVCHCFYIFIRYETYFTLCSGSGSFLSRQLLFC